MPVVIRVECLHYEPAAVMDEDNLPNTEGLAPLRWIGPAEAAGMTTWFASTQFGQYLVRQWDGRTNWSYAFRNGSRSAECASIEEGKEAAWQHWRENIQRCFTPYPLDHTSIHWPKDRTDMTS